MRKLSALSRSHRLPNAAPQIRTAFSSMAVNTGSSSPGELLMTCRTAEVAVCCSSASASFFSKSSMRASYAVAFVLVERRLVVRLRLFAPLRDKVTSSAQSLIPLGSTKDRARQSNRTAE